MLIPPSLSSSDTAGHGMVMDYTDLAMVPVRMVTLLIIYQTHDCLTSVINHETHIASYRDNILVTSFSFIYNVLHLRVCKSLEAYHIIHITLFSSLFLIPKLIMYFRSGSVLNGPFVVF